MTEMDSVLRGKMNAGKAGKGVLLGFLGIGLACLGCCLAPILGSVAFAGLGTSIPARINSHSMLIALVAGSIGLTMLWVWRKRSKNCCGGPNADSSTRGCRVPGKTTNDARVNP